MFAGNLIFANNPVGSRNTQSRFILKSRILIDIHKGLRPASNVAIFPPELFGLCTLNE